MSGPFTDDSEVEMMRRHLARVEESAARRVAELEATNAGLVAQLARRSELEVSPVMFVRDEASGADIARRLAAMCAGRSTTRALIFDTGEQAALMRRPPTVEEMERYIGPGEDEIPVGRQIPIGWPTIRRCRHCREPVAGGPTACDRCVYTRESRDRADLAERVLADAVESGRVAVHVVIDRVSSRPFIAAPIDPRSIPAALTVRLGDDAVIEADATLVGAMISLYRVESSALGRGMATTSESAVVVRQIDEMMRARREAAQEEIDRAKAEEAP